MNTIIKSKYMMATTAIHKTGDINRKEPDLCIIFKEEDDNYIGNWVTGFGFIGVKFPKNTTRDLTPEEVEKYHGKVVTMGDGFFSAINIKNEDFRKPVTVTKKKDGKVYKGTLVAPIKVGGVIAMFTHNGPFMSSTIKNIYGNEIETRNSTYIIEYEK